MTVTRCLLWGVVGCLIVSGAGSSITAQSKTTAKEDLSIPVLEPKPLVWVDDWEGFPEVSKEREAASAHCDQADALKASKSYDEAEAEYQAAIKADPSWPYPHYQLACNYELWEKPDQAGAAFDEAIKLGFDDFPVLLKDDELGSIRQRADFQRILKDARERYVASSAQKVGQPIALKPEGDAPQGGWPIIVLLHGYGDNNGNYIDQAEAWVAQGFVAIALPGSIPMNAESFQWSDDSVEPTQRDVDAVLASPLLKGLVNAKQVYLMGFSQGALHAMILVSQKPDQFAGVVALSPGGSLARQIFRPNLKQKSCCVFIHGKKEPHAPIAALWETACKKAGWKYMSRVHPGAHHFPRNWDEMLPEVAKFLLEEK